MTTGLSHVVAYLVCSQPRFDLLWEKSQMQYGIVAGIITGVVIGASQWIILRKYISDWKWILVVGISTTFISTIQSALEMWNKSIFSSYRLSELATIFFLTVNVLAGVGLVFIYGYLQWCVLRPYIAKAHWWIFVPFIAALIVLVTLSLSFLTHGLLTFNISFIQLIVLPATQAIGFCTLQKKSISDDSILQLPLALAPDIVNYWDIQRLEKILYTKISRIWKQDIEASIGELIYLVGINHNGDIITYHPINHTAIDNVDQIPLPELSRTSNDIILDSENLTSFAKFQVVFTPPSMIQIYSWRGIPIIWLGVSVYLGIVGISILCSQLKIDTLLYR